MRSARRVLWWERTLRGGSGAFQSAAGQLRAGAGKSAAGEERKWRLAARRPSRSDVLRVLRADLTGPARRCGRPPASRGRPTHPRGHPWPASARGAGEPVEGVVVQHVSCPSRRADPRRPCRPPSGRRRCRRHGTPCRPARTARRRSSAAPGAADPAAGRRLDLEGRIVLAGHGHAGKRLHPVVDTLQVVGLDQHLLFLGLARDAARQREDAPGRPPPGGR